jgi:hypothetical protein
MALSPNRNSPVNCRPWPLTIRSCMSEQTRAVKDMTTAAQNTSKPDGADNPRQPGAFNGCCRHSRCHEGYPENHRPVRGFVPQIIVAFAHKIDKISTL